MASKTIFQKIIEKEIPSEFIYEDDLCIVINDINPQAPLHLLIIPKKPLSKLSDAQEKDLNLLGHLMLVAGNMSRKFNVEDAFNIVINNGEKAGQTVSGAAEDLKNAGYSVVQQGKDLIANNTFSLYKIYLFKILLFLITWMYPITQI